MVIGATECQGAMRKSRNRSGWAIIDATDRLLSVGNGNEWKCISLQERNSVRSWTLGIDNLPYRPP